MEKRLREILLKTQRHLLLERRGEHLSRFAGEGLDFRELRPYTLDDDIRHLNWRSMARSRQPAVNVFNESRQINVVRVYLNSGGLAIGRPRSKGDLAAEILAALGFAALLGEDPTGALFFDRELRAWSAPSRERFAIERDDAFARSLDPAGRSVDYGALIPALLGRLKRRSVLYLIGDFMQPADLAPLALRHEVNVLIVRDRLDEELPEGEYSVVDAGSGRRRELLLDKATRRRYRRIVREHDATLAEAFRRRRIRWEKIYTHEEAIGKLIRFTRRRG